MITPGAGIDMFPHAGSRHSLCRFRFCWATIISGAAFLLATSTAGAQADRPVGRWAVLIGIDDYAELEKLKFCGADQRDLASQLEATGFPKDHVFLLYSKASDQKYLPTRQNIEKQIKLVLDLAEPGDVALVAFSGHGVHIEGTSYLCPSDASFYDGLLADAGEIDPKTLIALPRLFEMLDRSQAELKLAIIDACRNVPVRRGLRGLGQRGAPGLAADTRPPQGVLMFTSCSPGQVANEEPELGHGVFMHYLLEGLKGHADENHDRRVSLFELSSYAGDHTKTYVARRFNAVQKPYLHGDGAVEALKYPLALLTSSSYPEVPAERPTTRNPGNAQPVVPGEVMSNSIGMKLVLIPSGEFLMGNEETIGEIVAAFPEANGDELVDANP